MKKRTEIIKELKREHDRAERQLKNDVGSQRAYVNLPITLLERTFFDIIAKEVYHKDQTKLLRSIIHKLMDKHPECVVEAKKRIKEMS